jgi:hypothetical protein
VIYKNTTGCIRIRKLSLIFFRLSLAPRYTEYNKSIATWLRNFVNSFTEEKRKCPTVGHVTGNMKKALRL